MARSFCFSLVMLSLLVSFEVQGASPTIVIERSSVAFKRSGTVTAWGGNSFGQTSIPAGLSGVIAVAACGNNSAAIKSDGTVVVWGDSSFGATTVPDGLSGVTAIAVGGFHVAALKGDHTVVSWGFNATVPEGLTGVTNIAAGDLHTVAIKDDGTVVAWGDNTYGQTTVPSGLNNVIAVSAGDNHTVALKEDGTVVSWGGLNPGALTVPNGLSGVIAIAAGDLHTVALKNDGTVVTWGDNTYGQTTVPHGLIGVTAIAAGAGFTVAVKGDGTVIAWGHNATVAGGVNSVTAIAAGNFHTLARQGTPTSNLGSQLVNTTGSAVTFTIKNTGGADLILGSLTKDGLNPGDFTISTPGASTLAPGGSTTFTASFTPGGLGARSAVIHIPDNDSTLPSYDLVLTGTGTPSGNANLASLVLSSGTLSPGFSGSTVNYTASVPKAASSITVTPSRAEANATIKVNGTSVQSGTASGSIPLNAGANTITTVVTAQDGTTTKTYTINLTRLVPEINVTGNNVSIVAGDVNPTTNDHTDFGNARVSNGTVVRTFTIANSGTDTLALTGNPIVSVSGSQAGDFTVTVQPGSSVAASGTTTFQVTFAPTAAGLRTATLTIANDDSDESSYDFAVQGTGTVTLNPPIVSAGNHLEINWPVAGTEGFILQSSLTLGETADWQDVVSEPTVVDGTSTVSVSTQTGQRFYRLIQLFR